MGTVFFKPKDKELAKKISITSPAAFDESISKLKKGGITLKEHKALVLARTRAKLQLKRKLLSLKERKQMSKISKASIPR